jgi:membrane protease YdiL (CAAX protease family)
MAGAGALPESGGANGRGKMRSKTRSRGRDLAEIAVAYGLIMLVIWTPRPAQRYLWIVAAASVVAILCVSFDGAKAMGLRGANFLRSLWIAGAALLVAGIAILIAALLGTLRMPNGVAAFMATYCAYSVWSGVQQFLLQCFFLLRFLRLISNPRMAALTAALLFATAHLPSPVLAPVTFVWGFVACLHFLRYRNLYPLAIAHAILGIAVAITIPGPVDHNMRVGLGYLRYGHHAHGARQYFLTQPSPKP